MTTKTSYTATFSNGEVASLKASTKAYTHAWQYTALRSDGKPVSKSGFASSEELARKAATSESGWLVRPGRSAYDRRTFKAGSNLRIEVVAVTAL